MKQNYFPGHEKPKKIELIESGGIKSVVVNGKIYMRWDVCYGAEINCDSFATIKLDVCSQG